MSPALKFLKFADRFGPSLHGSAMFHLIPGAPGVIRCGPMHIAEVDEICESFIDLAKKIQAFGNNTFIKHRGHYCRFLSVRFLRGMQGQLGSAFDCCTAYSAFSARSHQRYAAASGVGVSIPDRKGAYC